MVEAGSGVSGLVRDDTALLSTKESVVSPAVVAVGASEGLDTDSVRLR